MRAGDLLPVLSGARPSGADKWIARCPAHDDKSPSLAIRQTEDRVLLYCWAGCAAADICGAIGISFSDLYSHSRSKPDPAAARRRRAAEGLEAWRQSELKRIAEELRGRDTIIRQIHAAM